MALLWTLVIGFVIGLVARFVMPGRDAAGIIVTTLLGIAGSFVGGWLFPTLGFIPATGLARFAVAVVGAVILLAIYRALSGRRGRA